MSLNFASRGESRFGRSFVRSIALLLALAALAADARAANFTVGSPELIYNQKTRQKKNLASWPDGNMGVVNNGNGTYSFYGANGTTPVRSTGTLTDPAAGPWYYVSINNVPTNKFNYVSGGPIFNDPSSGTRYMLYHAEVHQKTPKNFYSVLGLAVSRDPAGSVFTDLGTIIEPNISDSQALASIDIGGGSFAMKDGFLNVYYRDYMADGTSAQLAVARASVSDIVSNALTGKGTTFNKYYNGGWNESGKGGKASALEIGNPQNAWSSVSFNDYINQFVMVSSQPSATMTDLYMSTSSDGLNWAPRQAIAVDAGEQFYPTIIGTGADATRTDQSFYVYYTDSKKGSWNRWKDAALVRRKITFNSIVPPTTPPTTPPVTPPPVTPPATPPPPPVQEEEPPIEVPTEWQLVSAYKMDYQTGAPAEGWKYVWNPSGRLGNQSTFVPLKWSSIAGSYNTTGFATTLPAKKKSHSDDYLHLSATSDSHPGLPGTMPIVGYTIQTDDGDGQYRLSESSIAKLDAIASKGEDGLGVSVYVNNTLIGAPTLVSTNGSPVNFDRTLGDLKVGDTIWVAISALANQNYDAFGKFDFSIERLVPLQQMAMMSFAGGGGIAGFAAPEPGTAALLLIAVTLGWMPRRRRKL